MDTLVILAVIGIVLLVLSRWVGKLVESLIGATAIAVILYAILRYLNLI